MGPAGRRGDRGPIYSFSFYCYGNKLQPPTALGVDPGLSPCSYRVAEHNSPWSVLPKISPIKLSVSGTGERHALYWADPEHRTVEPHVEGARGQSSYMKRRLHALFFGHP